VRLFDRFADAETTQRQARKGNRGGGFQRALPLVLGESALNDAEEMDVRMAPFAGVLPRTLRPADAAVDGVGGRRRR
jgi:hypothetical protein